MTTGIELYRWGIFAVASAILIGVGWWTNVRLKKKAAMAHLADGDEKAFLLGGNEMGPFVAAGTLMATGYSGWGFIGSPGTAYAYGTIEILANFLFAPAITFGALFFAGFMRKQGERFGALTVPEYLANTHRGSQGMRRLVHFLAAIATFVFMSVYMIGQIRAVASVASEWLGTSPHMSAIIFMAVVMIFTMQGGLLAVAITDTIMCCGMVIASCIVYYVITQDISLTELIAKVGEIKPEFINPTTSNPYGDPKYSVFLVFVYAMLFTTVLPYMSVRFLAMKKDMNIPLVALYMAPMGFAMSFVPLVGLYMFYKDPTWPQALAANAPAGAHIADHAMPVFLNTYLSPAVASIISLFIIFAMLSTISSVLQVQAAALSHDLYVSAAGRESRYADLLDRGTVVVTTVLGIVLTFFAPQGMLNRIAYIGTGGLISMLVGPTIIRTFIEGNLLTCLLSMITGFFGNVYLVLIYGKFGWVEAPIIAGIAGSLVYMIVGYVTNGMRARPLDSEEAAAA